MKAVFDLIQSLPKAELHLHIEGTLEPELMMKLSEKNHIRLPYASIEEIKKAYQFDNLQSFLDLYYLGAQVLITEQDFYDLTWAYLLRAKEDNVQHCEIFFDPQTHTDRGIPFSVVIEGIYRALEAGQAQLGISFKLIMCFLRHLPEAAAFKTLEEAAPYKNLIEAVGLDSSEVGHPPSQFERVFAKALEEGYKTVAHAGEEGPASYIWESIHLLKVKRIDHGVRCLEDPELISYLRQHQIPLTVCPLSNIKLKVFKQLVDHNLPQLLKENLLVTINSDDPAYFGGYVGENYKAIAQAFNLNAMEIVSLVKNSFSASFMGEEAKTKAIEQINAWVSQ